MSMQRKDPTEAIAALRADAITITTEQCIKAWREAVPGALEDPSHIDIVGAMGSASSIGLGIALAQPGRKVIVMDGDGSLLMQLGSLVTIAGAAPENFLHICSRTASTRRPVASRCRPKVVWTSRCWRAGPGSLTRRASTTPRRSGRRCRTC